MKRDTVKFALPVVGLLSLGMFVWLYAGDLNPPAGPVGPTMKTLDQVEPRTPIPGSAAPAAEFAITEPGSYYLAGTRHCSGNGLSVGADDVTIDLMGHRLVGPDDGTGTGIVLNSGSNIEIKNGTIRDFGDGVSGGTSVKEVRVIHCRVVSNTGLGISLDGVGGLIKDCTVSENGDKGVVTARCYTINGCVARQNSGIGIHAGHGNTVIGNTVYYNQDTGMQTGNGCVISHNAILDNNGQAGLLAGTACTISYNNMFNSQSGCQASFGSTVVGNVARENEMYGFDLRDCYVDQNTATANNTLGGFANMRMRDCTPGTNHAP